MNYFVLAFYQLAPLEDPKGEVAVQKAFLNGKDARARIYVSEEGINGQMSLAKKDAESYIEWMHSRKEFSTIPFKVQEWPEQAFPKLTIKYRKQLVAFDRKVDLSKKGKPISAADFKQTLSDQVPHVLLDVRNDYEWAVGHFEGARLPPCGTFREFHGWTEALKQEIDPKTTPVLLYCTGGIRCEFYSALLIEEGFQNVRQLDGGVIQYGLSEGSQHWKGKLFVFDDRLTVPVSEEETPVIGTCHHCKCSSDAYYNCANMDCNELFLCCKTCLEAFCGCCSPSCQAAPRLRPYEQQNAHKPFRKRHHYFATTFLYKTRQDRA